jgi:ADP-heptose:LPS heptosyltransferase
MCPGSVAGQNGHPWRQRLRLSMLRLAARWAPMDARSGVPSDPPRSVLLVRPDHLGDVLFTVPALRHLRRTWPEARLTMLVGPWSRAVADGIPYLDEVITCSFPWFSRKARRWPLEPYWLLRSEARRIAVHGFEMSIVLRFDHWWGAWLTQWAAVPHRWGYDVAEVSPFLTRTVPYVSGSHEVLQNLTLVEAATGSPAAPGDRHLEFRPSAEDILSAGELLAEEGVQHDDTLACVHPGTGARVKLWRNEAWAEVIESLVREHGMRVVVTGGPGETELVADLMERLSVSVINLVGRTSLGQLASILERCRLVLGVDSGPMHLAVAMGRPTVHLYGPVDARLFGPWGDPQRHLVLTSDRECIPCNRLDYTLSELGAHPCVREIAVEPVVQAVRQVLRSTS